MIKLIRPEYLMLKNSITIIIPCVNEQEILKKLLERLNDVTGEIKGIYNRHTDIGLNENNHEF